MINKKLLILAILICPILHGAISITFNGLPEYYIPNKPVRLIKGYSIDFYYQDIGQDLKYFDKIIIDTNGTLNKYSISFPGKSTAGVVFICIYNLDNDYDRIVGYSNQFYISDYIDNVTEYKKRLVPLTFNSNNNTIGFPLIKYSSRPELGLAMHAHYVLTNYMNSTLIKPYLQTKNYKNSKWPYPLPVNITPVVGSDTCFYDPYQSEHSRSLNISTKWAWCSLSDNAYKHEFGHHLYYTVYNTPVSTYSEYDIDIPVDEQTAVNEGLSFFLQSEGPFTNLMDDNDPSYKLIDPRSDLFKTGINEIRTRSGEACILFIAITLKQISLISGNTQTVLDIYQKGKVKKFKDIWDQLSNSEKYSTLKKVKGILAKYSTYELKTFLEYMGIVFSRGRISSIASGNNKNGVMWGNYKLPKKEINLETTTLIKRKKINFPKVPSSIEVHLKATDTAWLSRDPGDASIISSSLKLQGGSNDKKAVTSIMDAPNGYILQVIELDKTTSSNIKKLKMAGPDLLNKGVLQDFYTNYWTKTWRNEKSNNNIVILKNLNMGSVYALRVKAIDKHGSEDSLAPEYAADSTHLQILDLIQYDSLFFVEVAPTPILKNVHALNGWSKDADTNLDGNIIEPEMTANLDNSEGYDWKTLNYVRKQENLALTLDVIFDEGVDEETAKESIKQSVFYIDGQQSSELVNFVGINPEGEAVTEVSEDSTEEATHKYTSFTAKYTLSKLEPGTRQIRVSREELPEDADATDLNLLKTTGGLIEQDVFCDPSNDTGGKEPAFEIKHKRSCESECEGKEGEELEQCNKDCSKYYVWVEFKEAKQTETESGIAPMKNWAKSGDTTESGYTADSSFAQYESAVIDWDIDILEFKIGEHDVELDNALKNREIIFNPLNGFMQIGDTRINGKGKIKIKATDRAGNTNTQTYEWKDEEDDYEPTEEDVITFVTYTDDREFIPEVDPEENEDTLFSEKASNDQYIPVTLRNQQPQITKVSLPLENGGLPQVSHAILLVEWYDDDDNSTIEEVRENYGIDLNNTWVSTPFGGVIPNTGDNYSITGLRHDFGEIDDDLFLEDYYKVYVHVADKTGSYQTIHGNFTLNKGPSDVDQNSDSLDLDNGNIDFNISDNDGYGTPNEDLRIVTLEIVTTEDGETKSVVATQDINPVDNDCVLDDNPINTRREGIYAVKASTPKKDSSFTFDTETGKLSYNFQEYKAGQTVQLTIQVVDRVCNFTTKTITFTVPETYQDDETSGGTVNLTVTDEEDDDKSNNATTNHLYRSSSGGLELEDVVIVDEYFQEDVLGDRAPYGQVVVYYKNTDSHTGKLMPYNLDYNGSGFRINGESVNNFLIWNGLNLSLSTAINRLLWITTGDTRYYDNLQYYSELITKSLEKIADRLREDVKPYNQYFNYLEKTVGDIWIEFYPQIEKRYSSSLTYATVSTNYLSKIIFLDEDGDSDTPGVGAARINLELSEYKSRSVPYGNLYDYIVYNPMKPLPEGINHGQSCINDWSGCSNFYHSFNVKYTPKISVYVDEDIYATNPLLPWFEVDITDYGNDVTSTGITIEIDGNDVSEVKKKFEWDNETYSGTVKIYDRFLSKKDKHKAHIIIKDTNGNKAEKEIEFRIFQYRSMFRISKLDARDVEGNLDGVLNEGERIYLDIGLSAEDRNNYRHIKGTVVNRSSYIEGIPESFSYYPEFGDSTEIFNESTFELVVANDIFTKTSSDHYTADMTLKVTYAERDSGSSVTQEIPITLRIEKLNPALSKFRVWVNSSTKTTYNPLYTLNGGWETEGKILDTLEITHQGNTVLSQIDTSSKTFTSDLTLQPGENKIRVKATSTDGDSREVTTSVTLLSKVEVCLNPVGTVESQDVLISGSVKAINSDLERVEIFVNGISAGDATILLNDFKKTISLIPGDNKIRAVAHDNLGNSATDEITIYLNSDFNLYWDKSFIQTTDDHITLNGNWKISGDSVQKIVVTRNSQKKDVTISRAGKTFSVETNLAMGTNAFKAVGTTAAGKESTAITVIERSTAGILSITLDPLPERTVEDTYLVTGSFELGSSDPYTIVIEVSSYNGTTTYTPTIDHASRTYSIDLPLDAPTCPQYGDYECGTCSMDNTIQPTIIQGAGSEYDLGGIRKLNPVCASASGCADLCLYSIGTVEGTFGVNTPGADVGTVTLTIHTNGPDFVYNVTNYYPWFNIDFGETHHFEQYVDISPYLMESFETSVIDTLGNECTCGNIQYCIFKKNDPVPLDEDGKKKPKRQINKNKDKRENRKNLRENE